jgi:hypothetical protein
MTFREQVAFILGVMLTTFIWFIITIILNRKKIFIQIPKKTEVENDKTS